MYPKTDRRSAVKTFTLTAAAVCALCVASAASAQSVSDADKELLNQFFSSKSRYVLHLALNPVVVKAVRLQNRDGLSLSEIKLRDETWKASEEIDQFKRSLMNSAAGKLIKKTVQGNEAFTEAFLTDNQGANVAVFPPTSDYWQGDEDKWFESFNDGAGKVWIGSLEQDESTGQYQAQVSVPVYQRGETIGVLVVGVASDFVASN